MRITSLGSLARSALLVLTAALAVVGEWILAPRAWEIVSYAHSYAVGHVQAQMWTESEASWRLAQSMAINFVPLIALAACPLLVGWWLSRWK